jgi:hypothetical protein
LIEAKGPELVGPGVAGDGDGTVGRVALIAVADVDRRAMAAAAFASALQPDTLLAVHVAVDGRAAVRLDAGWMRSPLGDVPLQVVDDVGGVARTLRLFTMELLADGACDVTVVVGRLAMPGVARLLLHDRTADAISRSLAVVGARVARVPVSIGLGRSIPRPRVGNGSDAVREWARRTVESHAMCAGPAGGHGRRGADARLTEGRRRS